MSPAPRRSARALVLTAVLLGSYVSLLGCTRDVCVPLLEPSVVTRVGSVRTDEALLGHLPLYDAVFEPRPVLDAYLRGRP